MVRPPITKAAGHDGGLVHKSHIFTCSQSHPTKKGGCPRRDNPPKKNRGSDLLSHPTTGQYHQRKET